MSSLFNAYGVCCIGQIHPLPPSNAYPVPPTIFSCLWQETKQKEDFLTYVSKRKHSEMAHTRNSNHLKKKKSKSKQATK